MKIINGLAMKKFVIIVFASLCLLGLKNQIFAEAENDFSRDAFLTENTDEIYPSISQPQYKPAFLKMLLILTALIALVILTFWIFKRLMRVRIHQGNMTKNIKILEKRIISPKSILYLIEIEGKRVLISESNLEVRKIKDFD